jgi:hypothetical protein
MNCGLTLSAGDHQSGSHDNQKDTHGRRDFLVIVCRNADMRVAEADAVMFGMGEGNEKGKHAQHQQKDSNDHQSFQGHTPERTTAERLQSRPGLRMQVERERLAEYTERRAA